MMTAKIVFTFLLWGLPAVWLLLAWNVRQWRKVK